MLQALTPLSSYGTLLRLPLATLRTRQTRTALAGYRLKRPASPIQSAFDWFDFALPAKEAALAQRLLHASQPGHLVHNRSGLALSG